MSNKIFKYEVCNSAGGLFSKVEMPRGAQILSVGLQGDSIVLWAMVFPTNHIVRRNIAIIGTGWDLHDRDITPENFLGHLYFIFLMEEKSRAHVR